MTEVRVVVDERAVRELFSDWNGPVGKAVAAMTDEVEAAARIMAPVSARGSKYAWPGYLKAWTREAVEHHYDDQGFVLGLVGAPVYPYAFVSNFHSRKGYTVNRGHRSVRRADDRYLDDALDSVPYRIFGEELWPGSSRQHGSVSPRLVLTSSAPKRKSALKRR